MSERRPTLTGQRLVSALERAGFSIVGVRSSHHFMRHEDGRTTVVPVHAGETIGPGLLSKILRDVELTRAQLTALTRRRKG